MEKDKLTELKHLATISKFRLESIRLLFFISSFMVLVALALNDEIITELIAITIQSLIFLVFIIEYRSLKKHLTKLEKELYKSYQSKYSEDYGTK